LALAAEQFVAVQVRDVNVDPAEVGAHFAATTYAVRGADAAKE